MQSDDHLQSVSLLQNPNYDPNNLLNVLLEKLQLKNDVALSNVLGVHPPVISKIRHRMLPVGAALLLKMHEASDVSIRNLRILMGDRRERFNDRDYSPGVAQLDQQNPS